MSDYSVETENLLCEPLVAYSKSCHQASLFDDEVVSTSQDDIKVLELFAGVGGF